MEKRATQKAGVINYLNHKISDLSKQKEQIEQAIATDGDVDIDAKIDDLVVEIETIEKKIVDASGESRKLLAQIYEVNAKLQEARFLGDRYKALRSQYMSDIKRLNFIVDGNTKGKKIRHKDSCPFCGHNIDIWKELSDSINAMIKACAYNGRPESYLNINTADVVVGGKQKKHQGKGYRAFLNKIMLLNLMKYLENKGKYAAHLLILDSQILSLKEKKYDISEKEKATAGMRESLIRYIIDNCGNNQVIIAENGLPENIDYSKVHQLEFTMGDGEGER